MGHAAESSSPQRTVPPPDHPHGPGDVDVAGSALGLLGDPGEDYRPSEPTRWTQPWSGTTRSVWVVIGAVLVGFLLASGVTAGRSAARVQNERKAEIIALIEDRMVHTEALAVRLEELRIEVAAAEAQAAAGLPVLRAQLADAEAKAGLTRVRGPGVRVVLADASSCLVALPENCRIQDADVQMGVNTLFALGAEAVAVNGERIIATSAVRSAGRAILVNYRVLSPPYTIEAIGDQEALEARLAASSFAADFEIWRDQYGLGYTVTRVDELLLPAFGGSVRLRTAVVDEGAS